MAEETKTTADMAFGGITIGAFFDAFGVLLQRFRASVVSLACWCHPVRCLWLAWAVCVLVLLLFLVLLARLGCMWALFATF